MQCCDFLLSVVFTGMLGCQERLQPPDTPHHPRVSTQNPLPAQRSPKLLWQIRFSSLTPLLNFSACSTADNPATTNTAQMELSSSLILSFRHRWKAEETADFPFPVMYSLLNAWLSREVTKHPLNDLHCSRHLGLSLAQSDTSAGIDDLTLTVYWIWQGKRWRQAEKMFAIWGSGIRYPSWPMSNRNGNYGFQKAGQQYPTCFCTEVVLWT